MKQTLGNQRGMALLLVLMVVALLSALLTELAFSTLVDLRLAETFRDSTRAAYLAKGGVRVGRALLQEDRNGWDHPSEFWGIGVAGYPVGDGVISVGFEDMDGRLNVNRLVRGSGITQQADSVFKERFYGLLNELGIVDPEDLTAALIDWIDEDDVDHKDTQPPWGQGAESNYYLQLETPYRCKNAPLDSLDELALVKGFTPEVIRSLAPHISTYGGPELNVNTASREVLSVWHNWSQIGAPPDIADTIVADREVEAFKKNSSLTALFGTAIPPTDLKLESKTFLIDSRGEVNDGRRTVKAIVRKSGEILYLKVN